MPRIVFFGGGGGAAERQTPLNIARIWSIAGLMTLFFIVCASVVELLTRVDPLAYAYVRFVVFSFSFVVVLSTSVPIIMGRRWGAVSWMLLFAFWLCAFTYAVACASYLDKYDPPGVPLTLFPPIPDPYIGDNCTRLEPEEDPSAIGSRRCSPEDTLFVRRTTLDESGNVDPVLELELFDVIDFTLDVLPGILQTMGGNQDGGLQDEEKCKNALSQMMCNAFIVQPCSPSCLPASMCSSACEDVDKACVNNNKRSFSESLRRINELTDIIPLISVFFPNNSSQNYMKMLTTALLSPDCTEGGLPLIPKTDGGPQCVELDYAVSGASNGGNCTVEVWEEVATRREEQYRAEGEFNRTEIEKHERWIVSVHPSIDYAAIGAACIIVAAYVFAERSNPAAPTRTPFRTAHSKQTLGLAALGVCWIGILLGLVFWLARDVGPMAGMSVGVVAMIGMQRLVVFVVAWESAIPPPATMPKAGTTGSGCAEEAWLRAKSYKERFEHLFGIRGKYFGWRLALQDVTLEITPQLATGLPNVCTALDRTWSLCLVALLVINVIVTYALLRVGRSEVAFGFDMLIDAGYVVINAQALAVAGEANFLDMAALLVPLCAITHTLSTLLSVHLAENQERQRRDATASCLEREDHVVTLPDQHAVKLPTPCHSYTGNTSEHAPGVTNERALAKIRRVVCSSSARRLYEASAMLALVLGLGGYFIAMVVAQENICKQEFGECVWNRVRPRVYFERSPWDGETTCRPELVGEVDASDCGLVTVESSFQDFTNVQRVDLRGNDLSTLDKVLVKLVERQTSVLLDEVMPHILTVDWTSSEIEGEFDLYVEELLSHTPNLETLRIGGNRITSLDGLDKCACKASLRAIDAGDNHLEVADDILGALPKLQWLNISSNKLRTITKSMAEWEFQGERWLDFGYNPEVIEIKWTELNSSNALRSPSLPRLNGLRTLAVLRATFDSVFPSQLCRLTQLENLQLARNAFRGTLPSAFGSLTELQDFLLDGNDELEGSLPTQLAMLTKLTRLHVNANRKLSGSIPGLANLTSMQALLLSTSFGGTFPSQLGQLTRLRTLRLYSLPALKGTLPSLGSLTELQQLLIYDNRQISGTIPSSLGALTKLQILSLSRNALNGTIPSSLGALTKLQELRLDNNKLTGQVPATFEELRALVSLNINNNQLNATAAVTIEELKESLPELSKVNSKSCCP